MPEIKQNFFQGKMNKDLDERLVPNGQYTHANNIQVSTSDADNVGTVQSLLGNSAIPVASPTVISDSGVCVGAIADESNNAAYWLIASSNDWSNSAPSSAIITYKDMIYKSVYNATADTHTVTPVFVDFWLEKHQTPSSSNWTGSGTYTEFTVSSASNLSTGMYVKLVGSPSETTYRKITVSGTTIDLDSPVTKKDWDWIEFSWYIPDSYNVFSFGNNQHPKRVLRFDKNKLITGLNIIDDLLFWTDNNTEPKKINIPRCILGTDDVNTSTKLISGSSNYLDLIDASLSSLDLASPPFYKESDITVIKKNPETAPVIELSSLVRSGTTETSSQFNFASVNAQETITIVLNDTSNYKSNDTLLFGQGISPTLNNFDARGRIKSIDGNTVTLLILNISASATFGAGSYNVVLENVEKNLFEEKFVRFAVRWKYADGEYSTISPFSDIAFAPGDFNYETIGGYNKGMVNQIKEVIIKDFIPTDIPEDVVQIDILYKESNSPIIYTVDNISKEDIIINGSTNAWNTINKSLAFQGRYVITSENIYSPIPSNQILRHFDEVPRKALAQSVIGNRVVYANYLQNYDVKDDNFNAIKPQLDAFVSARIFDSAEMLKNNLASATNNSSGNKVDGWIFDSGWKSIDYALNDFLQGGFVQSTDNGVGRFNKIKQNLDLENNESYRVKFKITNYSQGSLRLRLIGSSFYAEQDFSADGEYDVVLTLSTPNVLAIDNLFNNGTTFSFQSQSTTNNFIGRISNFSCKKIVNSNKKSIKSQRNYQVGVVYADKFGRQTPILTDETASLKVAKIDCANQNSIKVKLQNEAPAFAHTFKFFVKETSSEYYNLAVDRIYRSLDDNVWVSFPSSERNKVDEENYLVLKKQINGTAVTEESATYKILAIKNEAPQFIRLNKKVLATASGLNSSAGINTLFGNSNYRPVDDQKVLAIDKDLYLNNDNGVELENLDRLFLKFKDGNNTTVYYEVESVSVREFNNKDFYFIHLVRNINDYDASWIMNNTSLNTNVVLTIAQEKDELKPEFEGKFFVKLLLDDNLRNYVLSQILSGDEAMGIVARTQAWYASDAGAVGDTATATRYQKQDTNILVETDIYNSGTPNIFNPYPFNNGSDNFDNSGDSSYSPSRGVIDQVPIWPGTLAGPSPFIIVNMFRGSKDAMLKWIRILKFKLYSSWSTVEADMSQSSLNATRKNFFIDRVGYVGIQPLDQEEPINGKYRDPGYWDHEQGRAIIDTANNPSKYGRGIFQATGGERDIEGNIDTWFVEDNYYMELSYCKIWANDTDQHVSAGDIDEVSSWKDAWSVGNPNNSNHIEEKEFVKKLRVGSKFRFSGDSSEKTYEIKKIRLERRWNHTPHPLYIYPSTGGGSGQTAIIAKSAPDNNGNTSVIRMNNLKTQNTSIQDISFAPAQRMTGNKIEDFSPVAPISVHASTSLTYEKARFGYATNRRLTWTMEIEEAPGFDGNYNPLSSSTTNVNSTTVDEDNSQFIEFVEPDFNETNQIPSTDPAIFETQPKTDEGLDIYYEASDFISVGDHHAFHELPWFNCYSFGNGVESNRIKDDFNQVVVDKNPRASTTFQGEYEEEQRKYGLIYSGIYNSKNGVNNTNQFIAAEKITKDINPEYGSIQKLYARNSDLLTLCEDKVLRVQANKDALFNADGNVNIVATENVLGQAIPFAGDYGISKNPESFSSQNYRAYFADKQRGAVLRLSIDGLTPISDAGMTDWFKDNLKPSTTILGSYDNNKKQYNLTLKGSSDYTISYKETVKGWTSFKSYIPDQGVSVANNYYTFAKQFSTSNSKIWWHHNNETRNNFYGKQYDSDVTFVLNEAPSVIKTFKTLYYEGTQAKVDEFATVTQGGVSYTDEEYYNLTAQTGWHAEDITTDKQSGQVNEFIEKEGKWFNFIKGDTTSLSNLDTSEFNVQGLGTITSHDPN